MALIGRRVAILVENFYEDLELWYPYYRLQEAGAQVTLLGTGKPQYTSKHGYPAEEDLLVDDAEPRDYHAVIVPGGYSPDHMRRHPPMIEFVRKAYDHGAIIAFICHGGWVPISAGILNGRKATSFFAIKDDLVNAGCEWLDAEVVRDGQLISSRTPKDLPAFMRAILEALGEG
ncbi:MAG: type 1 glutamine amidotransferase [Armatimonadetes bacterium]|nr:type 1 glutamine amidotransferase [Armatimonadota bacterium]